MSISNRVIAVTGATGFLGSHVALRLAATGATVRAVVRNPAKGDWLRDHGIELVQADLGEPATLGPALAGADAVVNTAALSIRTHAPWEAFYEANTVGSDNLMHAIGHAGVKRVVYVSTVAVYQTTRPFTVVDESAATHQEPAPGEQPWKRVGLSRFVTNPRYALSKALGEKHAWAIADEYGIDLTVLRPGPIWGSRDHKLTTSYRKLMRWPVLPMPTFRLPHVHADDVAEAIVGALENPNSAGRAYNVTGEPLSPYAILKAWKARAGSGPVLIPVPTPLWIAFDNGAAERDLGYTSRSLGDSIAEILG